MMKIWRLPPDEDQQVAITIAAMIEAAVADSWDLDLRWVASVMRPSPPAGAREVARRYTRFVREMVSFRLDPADVEFFRTPAALARDLRRGRPVFGDCDDMAVLLASLLLTQGVEVAFVTIATSPHIPAFRHVFVAAHVEPDLWASFDPSVRRRYNTRGLRHAWWPIALAAVPPPAYPGA